MGGARFERELVNALDACGYVAMRAPSSGSATKRELPDVLAMRPVPQAVDAHGGGIETVGATEALAIELKTTSRTTAYAGKGEVEDLILFAEEAGATPFVAGRFKRQGLDREHFLVPPAECRRTQGDDAGNYGVPEDGARERATVVVNATSETVERLERGA
jgi:Holliday junction resolvase